MVSSAEEEPEPDAATDPQAMPAGDPFADDGDGAPTDFDEEPGDVTIQFGEDGGDDVFGVDEGAADEPTGPSSDRDTARLQSQLDALLEACADRGYEDPEIALCAPADGVDEVELRLPADIGEAPPDDHQGPRPLPASRSTLLDVLADQYDGVAADERVGFVPMQPTSDGRERVLALIARPGGPFLSTLDAMQDTTLLRSPRVRLLDTDVSLYEGLARRARPADATDPDETTALVRVGVDDTLVLFLRGDTLLQTERLPELTADDPTETICSRALLLRDEYGVGRVHRLVLVADEREDELASAFEAYFSDAETQRLRTLLPGGEDAARHTTAIGGALRYLEADTPDTPFRPVDLLPSAYAGSAFRLPVGWSVPALLTLIGVATLGFVGYYVVNLQAIEERQAELRTLERQVEQADRQALEQRVQQLETQTTRYSDALETLDELVTGSNKWSRTLAAITTNVGDIRGLSIEQWQQEEAGTVGMAGRANDRSNVTELVRRLDGEIEALTFTDVRETRLYDFRIQIPLKRTTPEVVDYWQKQQRAPTMAEAEGDGDAGPERTAASQGGADESSPWMIVVASLSDAGAAATVRDRYRRRVAENGHEVRVHYSPQNERYRVGVVGFGSEAAARSAQRTLSGALPSNAWVHERASTAGVIATSTASAGTDSG
jgi:uncharacterized coiled-coil protein SlyX